MFTCRFANFESVSEELDQAAFKFKKVYNVRWLARRECIDAIKKNFRALLEYLYRESLKASNAADVRAAKFLYDSIRDVRFLVALYFFAELHASIGITSKVFQASDLNIHKFVTQLESLVGLLKEEFLQPIENGLFAEAVGIKEYYTTKGDISGFEVPYFMGHEIIFPEISSAPAAVGHIDRINSVYAFSLQVVKPFVEELLESLETRFPRKGVLKAFQIFDLDKFPTPGDGFDMFGYGAEDLETLLAWFATEKTLPDGTVVPPIIDAALCRKEWKALKHNIYNHPSFHKRNKAWVDLHKDLKHCSEIFKLVSICLVLPLSTAIVERGFSTLNSVIKSKLRNRLSPETCDILMRISINGPELWVETTVNRQTSVEMNPVAKSILQRAKQDFASMKKRQTKV